MEYAVSAHNWRKLMYNDIEDAKTIIQALKSRDAKTRDRAEEVLLILLAWRGLKVNDEYCDCANNLIELLEKRNVL